MTYHSFCQKCKRVRELTEKEFKRFLSAKPCKELNKKERSGEVLYAKIEFSSGCPDCVGAKGESKVKIVIGKKKKPTQH